MWEKNSKITLFFNVEQQESAQTMVSQKIS
jgi:hypothetical protein